MEQPLPELAEPNSPKPRGRRPGSKNKPKLPLFAPPLPAAAAVSNSSTPQARNGVPGLEMPDLVEDDLDGSSTGSVSEATVSSEVALPPAPQSRLRKPGMSLLRTIMSRYVFVQRANRGEDWKRRIVQRY